VLHALTPRVILHTAEMHSKSAAVTLGSMSALLASSCLQTGRLPDGTLVTIRAIRPDDLEGMRRAFDGLSLETRYLRFHAHMNDLSQQAWHYLTHVDGQDHLALVARVASRIVGVARFIRLEEAQDGAEIAFVVADDFQRRGLGRLLRGALLVEAQRRGIRWFQATVLPDNAGIRRLLDAPPLGLVSDSGDQLVVRLARDLPCAS
jgi:RimJ/RimL family protein N-acetyltransferase